MTIVQRRPPVSAIVPLFSVVPWFVQLFTTRTPLTHSRTPSLLTVVNVYVVVAGGSISPDQRALNVSAPIPGAGAPAPQVKSMVGSTRVNVVPVRSLLSKYVAVSPLVTVPVARYVAV